MRRDKIYSAPHLLLPLSLLLACSSCRGEVISQELSKGYDFGNLPDNHSNNGQTEMLGFKLIFSSKRKLAFKKQKFERIWLIWKHFCMATKLFFTWKMIETNIQSNVPVICVVIWSLLRMGEKAPNLLGCLVRVLFSGHPCTALVSLRPWGHLECLPTSLLIAIPLFIGMLFTKKVLSQAFSFKDELDLPVSKWIVVCRVLLSERRDQLWCNSKDPGDRGDLGATPCP